MSATPDKKSSIAKSRRTKSSERLIQEPSTPTLKTPSTDVYEEAEFVDEEKSVHLTPRSRSNSWYENISCVVENITRTSIIDDGYSENFEERLTEIKSKYDEELQNQEMELIRMAEKAVLKVHQREEELEIKYKQQLADMREMDKAILKAEIDRIETEGKETRKQETKRLRRKSEEDAEKIIARDSEYLKYEMETEFEKRVMTEVIRLVDIERERILNDVDSIVSAEKERMWVQVQKEMMDTQEAEMAKLAKDAAISLQAQMRSLNEEKVRLEEKSNANLMWEMQKLKTAFEEGRFMKQYEETMARIQRMDDKEEDYRLMRCKSPVQDPIPPEDMDIAEPEGSSGITGFFMQMVDTVESYTNFSSPSPKPRLEARSRTGSVSSKGSYSPRRPTSRRSIRRSDSSRSNKSQNSSRPGSTRNLSRTPSNFSQGSGFFETFGFGNSTTE